MSTTISMLGVSQAHLASLRVGDHLGPLRVIELSRERQFEKRSVFGLVFR